ncbi:hypothetical protein MNEG_10029 [Monoraphidium neglectum]|uniref:Uncharacterized protein n=1 Tax=Monoraphidium neglectum TaxID=145388 RepID=A0A0D2JEC7_9CHLO|nr:hypothetical protein MNEG_10029 [Monoraphidium neglectum]KIY97932.1 hypothetical protein MNEG_10029 [Monoraphidium neglectum]|eukprot:XP_013896952.1 hypothetical protein MNEG_10029 [Monoraphidium neglectum]
MRAAAVLILLAGAAVLTAAGAAPAASEAATALPDAAVAAATAATKLAHQTPSPGADDADGDDEPLFISPEEAAQQIAAAANPAAFADLDLPAPALVIHHGPGNVRVAREFAPGGSNDKAGRDAAAQRVLARFKTKKGAVTTGTSRKCSYPLNQLYFTEDSNKTISNLWLGSYSFNSYTFGSGNAGRNGPGKFGAACLSPPRWGPAFETTSKCSLAPPPFAKGMAQLALFNVYRDRPGDQFGAMTVVTSLKYYYGKAGGVERQEIVAQYWSPTRGFLTSFDIATGRPVTELSGNRAVHFKAPPGAVLGERLTTACSVAGQDRKNPIRKLSSVSRACAIKPTWYPDTRTFPSSNQAELYGYQCK